MKVGGVIESDRVNSGIDERRDVEPDETVPAAALTSQGRPAEAETAEEPKLQRQPPGPRRAFGQVGGLRRLTNDQR
jgi:hypothetical protein